MNASIFSIAPETQDQIAQCVAQIDTVRRLLDAGYTNEALALSAANLQALRQARRQALFPWSSMSQGAIAGFAMRSSQQPGARITNALIGALGGWFLGCGTRVHTIREIDDLIQNLQAIHEDLHAEALNQPPKSPTETPTPKGSTP